MTVHKATDSEMDSLRHFLQASEEVLERERYGLGSAEDKWESWDDEDEDKIHMLKIRERLAEELSCSVERVDNRILMYEFLKKKYSFRWHSVLWAADILIKNCCDPQQDILAFAPQIQFNHVSPEQ